MRKAAIAAALWALAGFWACGAVAADKPSYGPPAAWVQPASLPTQSAAADGGAVQVLLSDQQMRFDAKGAETYIEIAFRILTPQGLSYVNAIAPWWNPATASVTFHKFEVLRGGKVIDLLDGGRKVTVLRRETNLELQTLDGALTATVQPEGLQVGDIVDASFTLAEHDPVLHGYASTVLAMPRPSVVSRVRIRALWPNSLPVAWRVTEGTPAPKVVREGDETELVIDAKDFEAPRPPAGAPSRFNDQAEVELSRFADWSAVSALMAPLYEKAEVLAPGSPLRAEAQKIAAASADPKARAEAALRLVQDKVRYFALVMNEGGLVPADADVTWSRKFGDCKGKTALLLALLHALGIEAEPALVSTTIGDGLDKRLPSLLFDHVIVRAQIGGKTYWLDGTRIGDRALDGVATPDFHWALPVQASGARLERLVASPLDKPRDENLLRLDATEGLDAPAHAHAERLFRGDLAVGWNVVLTAAGREAADRELRTYWRKQLPWIDIQRVGFAFDDEKRQMRLTMDGSGAMDWERANGWRTFKIVESGMAFNPSFKRDPGPDADAPYAVRYPSYDLWTVTVALPDKGRGFGLMEAEDVDQTVAGVRYRRHSRIVDGVVTMTESEQALAPEFPASEAAADAQALRQLNAYDVAISYRLEPAPEPATAQSPGDQASPKDAADYETRGENEVEAGDIGKAVGDFQRAARLEPTSSEYAYNLGSALFDNRQDDLALVQFDRALALKPDNVLALQSRAELYLFRKDTAHAEADFAAANRLAQDKTKALMHEAWVYQSAGYYDEAIALYSQVIAKSPTAVAYNDRCWTRSLAGRELTAAISDCDAALRMTPASPAFLDSRGLAELKLGRFDEAIRDYSAALEGGTGATSLFGRGVAELRKGEKASGEADIAAARANDPQIEGWFAAIGVRP